MLPLEVRPIVNPQPFLTESVDNVTKRLIKALTDKDLVNAELLIEQCVDFTPTDSYGRDPLHIACQMGFTDLTRKILEKDTSTINSVDKTGNTPLLTALYMKHPECAKLLIKYGANVNKSNGDVTPLYSACSLGIEDVLKEIIDADKSTLICSKQILGSTPLTKSILNWQIGCAILLIEAGVDITVADKFNQTPLYCACMGGFETVVQKILEKDQSTLNRPDKFGNTPLTVSIVRRKTECAMRLIKAGVDVTLATCGNTPLFYACEYELVDIVREILEKDRSTLNRPNQHGITPLITSIARKDTESVMLLIKAGVDVTKATESGKTPLFYACEHRLEIIVREIIVSNPSLGSGEFFQFLRLKKLTQATILIKAGIDLTISNETGETALTYTYENNLEDIAKEIIAKNRSYTNAELFKALKTRNDKYLKFLIKIGVSLNEIGNTIAYADENDIIKEIMAKNTSYANAELFKAIKTRNVEYIKFLIKANADLTATDEIGNTPLYYACEFGLVDIVQKIIEKNLPETLDKVNLGKRYLNIAIGKGHLECAKLLINHNACINVQNKGALYIACYNGYDEIVEEILNKDKSVVNNVVSIFGETPLLMAVDKGYSKCIRVLIKHGADLTIGKKTALEIACEKGFKDCIKEILEADKSILNIQNELGRTPLIHALYKNQKNCAELLIKYDADLTKSDKNGQTALHIACDKGFVNIVFEILKKDLSTIDAKNKFGNTPLHRAVYINRLDCAKLLIESGADLNIVNSENKTSLVAAICESNIDCAELLIKSNADLTKSDKNGQTALHIACEKGFIDIVDEIIKKQLSILNTQNIYGNTPLHKAISANQIACAKLIIQYRADVNIINKARKTPLYISIEEQVTEILEDLLKAGANPNTRNYNEVTPFHLSISLRDEELTKLLLKYKGEITDIPDVHGDSCFSDLVKNCDIPLYAELATNFIDQTEGIDLGRGDSQFNTPFHHAFMKASSLLMSSIAKKIKQKDLLNKNIYYETPLQTPATTNFSELFSSKMEMLLSFIIQHGSKNNQSFIEEVRSKVFQDSENDVQKFFKQCISESRNPLEIPLFLNRHDLAKFIKKQLTEEQFKLCLNNILNLYDSHDFYDPQSFIYEIDPFHMQMGLATIPDNIPESVAIDDLLKIFDSHAELDLSTITPETLNEKTKSDLREILEDFIKKVKNRTVYTATPGKNQPEELEMFYKTIEIAQTHIIKKIQGDVGKEKEVLKTLLEEVQLCGAKIYSISVDLYLQLCAGESSDFESKVYRTLAELREGALFASIPRREHNVHDKTKLLEALGTKCGIPGSRSQDGHRDQYSIVSIDRAEKGFFRRYNVNTIINNIRMSLKEDDIKEIFLTWADKKDLKFESELHKRLKDSYEKLSKGEAVELAPSNLEKDLLRLAKHYGDDANVNDYLEEVIKAYLMPMCWMETDFDKILENGDDSFESLATELKEIIEKCNLKGHLTDKFKGKRYGDKTAIHERKRLFDKFCEMYGDKHLSNGQVAEILVELKVLKPIEQ